jgi:hypothetical protein
MQEDELLSLIRNFVAKGHEFPHAVRLAAWERNITEWGANNRGDLPAIVFGDFTPPDGPLHFPSLNITLDSVPLDPSASIARHAMCILQAKVVLQSCTLEGLSDAMRRLNLLVDVLSTTHRGTPVRWWSLITDPTGAAAIETLQAEQSNCLLALLATMPPKVRRVTEAALFWMREPRNTLQEHYRSEDLTTFAGYWNAFELLVEAVTLLRPMAKLSKDEKRARIRTALKASGRHVEPETIRQLYREVVDVGLPTRARHAIRLCCGDRSDDLFAQCFEIKPDSRRLYNIRNSINHGTIDVNDLNSLLWVESRFPSLQELVVRMLQGTVQLANMTAPPNPPQPPSTRERSFSDRLRARFRRIRHQWFGIRYRQWAALPSESAAFARPPLSIRAQDDTAISH